VIGKRGSPPTSMPSGSNTSLRPFRNPTLKKWRGWSWVVTDYISWPHKESMRLANSIPHGCPLSKWEIPKIRDKELREQALFMKSCLSTWEETFSSKKILMPATEVARRVCIYGPEFAQHIDDLGKYSLRSVTGYRFDDEADIDTDEDAWGWDYFPPTRGFINWRLPEPDDINLVFREPITVDDDKINKFKEYVDFFTKSDVQWDPEFDTLDALGCMGSTKTYSDKDMKSTPNIAARRLNKRFHQSDNAHFKYAFVQKSQCEGRAAVIPEMSTLPRIKLFHRMFRAVNCCPEDLYSDPTVTEGLTGWLTSRSWRVCYIMEDLKKSGLTFNRNLFNAIIDVLHQKYPTWGWDYWKDYASAKVFVNGEYKPMSNGFGLGMMDCVVSFAQAVLYRMWVSECAFPPGVSHEAKFWNDDSVVKVKVSKSFVNDDVLEVVYDIYKGFSVYMADYGMTIHGKKPYMSYKGVFLEYYGSDESWDHTKRGQFMCNCLAAILASDIAAAKEHLAAVLLEATPEEEDIVDNCIYEVQSHWGYEFDPSEAGLPIELGGWSYVTLGGFNTLLYEALDLPEEVLRKYHGFYTWYVLNSKKVPTMKIEGKLKERIDELSSIGPPSDPRGNKWADIIRTTLGNKIMGKGETLRYRAHILNQRRKAFGRHFDDPRKNPYGSFMEFSRTTDSPWYLRLPQDNKDIAIWNDTKGSKIDLPCEDPVRAYYELTDRLKLSEMNVSAPNLKNLSDHMVAYIALKNLFVHSIMSREELIASAWMESKLLDYAEALAERSGYYNVPSQVRTSGDLNKVLDGVFGKQYNWFAIVPGKVGIYPQYYDPFGYGFKDDPDIYEAACVANYLMGDDEYRSEFGTYSRAVREVYDAMKEPEDEELAFDPDRPLMLVATPEMIALEERLAAMVQGYQDQQTLVAPGHAEGEELLSLIFGSGPGPPMEEPDPDLGGIFGIEGDY